MKQKQGLGTPPLRDRADHDGDDFPDPSKLDFSEPGHTQPQPADVHPERRPPRRERHDHAT
ncbi:MAG TPA: hypothetical protein VFL64_16510 [Rhizobacter sp.]|nr:hypothetical protein [Rhizobacter sp.]